MDALDFISLQEAKEYLKIDFDSEDNMIINLIRSAVSSIEKKTSYMLYERNETKFISNCGDKIYEYPFSLAESEDADNYEIYENRLYSSITIIGGGSYPTRGRGVELTIGYNDSSLVPPVLKDACMRLITYWYDQREMETTSFPSDVYTMIQPWIRDFTI